MANVVEVDDNFIALELDNLELLRVCNVLGIDPKGVVWNRLNLVRRDLTPSERRTNYTSLTREATLELWPQEGTEVDHT